MVRACCLNVMHGMAAYRVNDTYLIFQSYKYNIVEIALNGKRQFLTLGTRMRDSFISLENQNIKLTFNGTAIPEQPRQSKRLHTTV